MRYHRQQSVVGDALAGSVPYFTHLLTPADPGLSPYGRATAELLQTLLGAYSASAAYTGWIYRDPTLGLVGTGSLPSVQTSPGVYESAFRLAGAIDPRQAFWDSTVGVQPTPQPTDQQPTAASDGVNVVEYEPLLSRLLSPGPRYA